MDHRLPRSTEFNLTATDVVYPLPLVNAQNLDDKFPDIEQIPQQASCPSFAPSFLKTARHPLICIVHLVFKILALLTFIFGSFVFGGWSGDFVFSFVITTLFLSMDFWSVKNITGRFLVGLRWWSHIKEDGTSEWIYETRNDERQINSTDKAVFWTGIYLWPFCWAILLVVYLFRMEPEWVLLGLIGLTLSVANFIGYWNCSMKTRLQYSSWSLFSRMPNLFSRFL